MLARLGGIGVQMDKLRRELSKLSEERDGLHRLLEAMSETYDFPAPDGGVVAAPVAPKKGWRDRAPTCAELIHELLSRGGEYTSAQIADEIGVNVNTVRSTLCLSARGFGWAMRGKRPARYSLPGERGVAD